MFETQVLALALIDGVLYWSDVEKTLRSVSLASLVASQVNQSSPQLRCKAQQTHTDWLTNITDYSSSQLLTVSDDRSVRLVDKQSLKALDEFNGHKSAINCVTFDQDFIVSGGIDNLALLFDIKASNQRLELRELLAEQDNYSKKYNLYLEACQNKKKKKARKAK